MSESNWSFSPAGSIWTYQSEVVPELTALLRPKNPQEISEYTLVVRFNGSIIEVDEVFGNANLGIAFVNGHLKSVTKHLTLRSLQARIEK